MEGEDESSSSNNDPGELSLIDLITDLASSRPDGLSEDERDELVDNATGLLSDDADNRQSLANHGGMFCLAQCFVALAKCRRCRMPTTSNDIM